MTATGISQKEYLKKYLSSGGDDKKKKKKKPRTKPIVNRLRIVDDDVDIHNMRPLNDDELELYNLQEDAPQIAGIIDERPEEVKIKEKYGSKKWKVVADENDMGVKIIDKSSPKDVADGRENSILHMPGENNEGDLSPPRKSRKDFDEMPISDESPRRNRRGSLENSSSNKRGQKSDSDESPPRKSRKSDKESVLMPRSSHTQDSDESPPRRNQKVNSEIMGHRRKGQNRITEESPPHKSKKNEWDSMQQSRRRQNYNSDESPPRRVKTSVGNMPPYRRQHNYHSDESPPRRKKSSNAEDISLYVKGQKYVSDMSPQRRSRKNSSENAQSCKISQKYDSDESPPRKTKQKDSESPPRRDVPSKSRMSHRRGTSPSRNRRGSPPSSRLKGSNEYMARKSRKSDSDESPPKRRIGESSSPSNRGYRRSSLPSPKRETKRSSRSPSIKNRKGRDIEEVSRKTSRWGKVEEVSRNATRDFSKHKLSPTHHRERGNLSHKDLGRNDHKKDERNPQRRPDVDVSPDRKTKQTDKVDIKKQTLDGRKAGLVGANELKAEIADLRQKEKEMFEKMDVSVSGRGAAPVMRDRKTGKKRDFEEEAREKHEKDEKQAERDAKYMQWGKGLKQVTDKAQKMEEDIYEMSKPLARYADDADLDKFLRDQDREGDPMLEYIRTKSKSQGESSKPRYQGSFMPNRFGIRPGYRWDGVDRSNGYEKQWFETQNAKKAVEEEAYKWSTADM